MRYLQSSSYRLLCNSPYSQDSDWSKCLSSRRSVIGYCVFFAGNLITWKSQKQSTVSRSSAEAEYRAMSAVACEVMWLMNILKELGVNVVVPVVVHCDNDAAISIAANPVFHERTKHFEIDLFFLREKIAAGTVRIIATKSENQHADILTKGLPVQQHVRMCNELKMENLFGK